MSLIDIDFIPAKALGLGYSETARDHISRNGDGTENG